jgi:hypothetical protein
MDSKFFTSGKPSPSLVDTFVLHSTLPHIMPEDKSYVPLTYILNSHIWEAIRLVWPDSHWAEDSNYRGIESRL